MGGAGAKYGTGIEEVEVGIVWGGGGDEAEEFGGICGVRGYGGVDRLQ